jgi:fibronectin type 3 domain-containing protein
MVGGVKVRMNASLLTSLSYVDQAVSAGATYYYTVTAVDSAGVESIHSNEVSGTVPSP